MVILATLPATVRTSSDGYPRLSLSVATKPSGDELALDVETLADEVGALAARAGQQIVAPWRVYVNGSQVGAHLILPGVSVSEGTDGVTQWQVALARDLGKVEPLGDPAAWLGVPGGQQEWKVTADLMAESGARRTYTLLDKGVADNASGGPSTRTWNGGGAQARYDRKLVTYTAPPGHGQRSSTVVRRLLDQAGVPHDGVSGGRRMYKPLSIVDLDVFGVCDAILEPEQRRVIVDARTGRASLYDYGAAYLATSQWTIGDSDVLSALGQLGDAQASDAPWKVTITGTAQVLREDCNLRTVVRSVETYAIFAPGVALSYQAADGSINPNSPSGAGGLKTPLTAELRLQSRVLVLTTYECDTVVAERELTLAWFVPETWRYTLDSAGLISAYNSGAYLYESAVKDDGAAAYAWAQERWGVVSDVLTLHSFDADGYRAGSEVRRRGYDQQTVPLKQRSTATGWEAVNYDAPLQVLARGAAVDSANATGDLTERWYGAQSFPPVVFGDAVADGGAGSGSSGDAVVIETTAAEVSEDGFVLSETLTTQQRTVRLGVGDFLHLEGESGDELPELRVVEVVRTLHLPRGETSHQRIVQRYDNRGRLVETVVADVDGYLPAAEQRRDLTPDPAIYDDASEATEGRPASFQEQQAIKGVVEAPALIPVHGGWERKIDGSEYAETVEDLERMAAWVIREASSITVSVPVPFSPILRRGQRGVIHLRSIAWHYDVVLSRVTHQQTEAGTWTQLEGEHYVV